MSNSLIQSARVLPMVEKLPFAAALKPGVKLTVPDPTGGIIIKNGVAVRDGLVDVIGYATRDRELQYRDIAVAQAIETIARRAATVFGSKYDFVKVPTNPDIYVALTYVDTLLHNVTVYDVFLEPLPMERGRVSVTIGGVRTIDDGRGNFIANGVITGGIVDYVLGHITVNVLVDTVNDRAVAVGYYQVQYLQRHADDINPDGGSDSLGGATGVEYVDNNSIPSDAIESDQDLFRRDLALYEVLTTADAIFVQLQNAWSASAASPTIPTTLDGTVPISGVTLDDAWSHANGTSIFALPGFGQRWSPDTFRNADYYLAWRDNVLAAYVSELSRKLVSLSNVTATLQVLATIGAGEPIIVNASQGLPEDPTPSYPDPTATVVDTPQALRPHPAMWLVNYAGYFAPFQTATKLLVRIADTQVDTYVPVNTSNLTFNLGTLDFDYDSGLSIAVLRFNDTEYVSLDGGVAQARLPRNEPELYLLTAEDIRYRTFSAYPATGNTSRTLVYDKMLALVRWYPHSPQDFMPAQPAGPTMQGTRKTQTVQVIASELTGPDSEYWRQKAAQVQATPCHERSSQYLSFPPITNVPFSYTEIGSSPTVLSTVAGIFNLPGSFRFENFPVHALTRETRAQWMQFNFLVTPVRSWYRHADTWSQGDSNGAISVDSSGMFLPPASSTNAYQLISNTPQAAWVVSVPTGSYNLFFEWEDLNTTALPLSFTVRWNNQVIFTGSWQATTPSTLENSPTCTFFAANSNPGILSLTWNTPTTANGIKITRLNFAVQGNVGPVDYKVNATFYDNDAFSSSLTPMPGQSFRFRGILNVADVLSTEWIDISKVDLRTVMNVELKMVEQPGIALAVTGVEVRTRIKIDPMTNWQKFVAYKDTCLIEALDGIQAKYARRVQATEIRTGVTPNFSWDSTVTANWLAEIALEEPRLSLAFRPARPGDIGRPTLVPTGVYFDGTSIIALNGPVTATPTLSPWQPWMAPLNFPVAMEDFWVVEEPTKPVKLLIIDPTGEDSVIFDPYAPNLDFSKSSNSMYLGLI